MIYLDTFNSESSFSRVSCHALSESERKKWTTRNEKLLKENLSNLLWIPFSQTNWHYDFIVKELDLGIIFLQYVLPVSDSFVYLMKSSVSCNHETNLQIVVVFCAIDLEAIIHLPGLLLLYTNTFADQPTTYHWPPTNRPTDHLPPTTNQVHRPPTNRPSTNKKYEDQKFHNKF